MRGYLAQLKRQFLKLNFWIVFSGDIVLLIVAHFAAQAIYFDFGRQLGQWPLITSALAPLLAMKIVVFHLCGLYRGMWRYTGMTDLGNILRAALVISLLLPPASWLLPALARIPRPVLIMDVILTLLLVAGARFALRIFYQIVPGFRAFKEHGESRAHHKRVLVIGAGDAAAMIARELLDNRTLSCVITGFLDDNPAKTGQRIHGIPVLGAIHELRGYVAKSRAQEVLIAIPSADRAQMSRIVELCRGAGVPFKTLPNLGELISDRVSVKNIREVAYRDLLGRPPVRLELERIEEIIAGQTVLVTGAGGSIGSELCRQIIRFNPARLILFDAGEYNLYQLEMELLHEHGFADYVTVLGKVQDRELLEPLFARYRPEVVLHAAAYKHVPMVERNPWEGIYNNVFASKRLMEAAACHGVERFILISTDKAVRPTSVMGASKRVAELIMQSHCGEAKAGGRTRFMAVRFGNVLGSSGSVIPLFKRQIELGGPVTVTDPEMTRYFMSIEEAAQLILQAAAMGEGGEIFILEMGTPVRIDQMARDLIRLCGKEPDSEVAIKYTGLRPGEKMSEELITEGEGIVTTGHEKIMVLRGCSVDPADLLAPLARLKQLAAAHDGPGIKAELQRVIPEYTPQEDVAVLTPN